MVRSLVKTFIGLTFVVALFGASGQTQNSNAELEFQPYPDAHITAAQWTAYFDKVKAARGAAMKTYADLHLVTFDSDRPGGILFAFTQPGHPAHPAWVARRLVQTGGNLSMDQVGYFAGQEPPFAAMFEQYQELSNKAIEAMRQNKPR
jgi:hypothetical protein